MRPRKSQEFVDEEEYMTLPNDHQMHRPKLQTHRQMSSASILVAFERFAQHVRAAIFNPRSCNKELHVYSPETVLALKPAQTERQSSAETNIPAILTACLIHIESCRLLYHFLHINLEHALSKQVSTEVSINTQSQDAYHSTSRDKSVLRVTNRYHTSSKSS